MTSSFKGHKFIETGVEDLTKIGFDVGAEVVTTKRFTVNYDPDNTKFRKDAQVGTECFIKGFTSDKSDESKSMLVINFEATFGKALKSVDMALAPDKFKLPADSVAAGAGANKLEAVFKKYPFLKVKDDDRVCEIVGAWSKRQMTDDTSVKTELTKKQCRVCA